MRALTTCRSSALARLTILLAAAGLIVDGGNFDWAKSGKFPGFTTPDASYNNMVYADDFGTLAFITKVRACVVASVGVSRPALCAGRTALQARVQIMRDVGSCLSPFNSFLLLLGVETLHVRMREHCRNALAVAAFLQQHASVAWVQYPGLEEHPTHALARKYFRDGLFGGARPCPWPGAAHSAAESRRRVRHQGRPPGGHALHRGAVALVAPGQRGRRQVARHPPRLHHARAAVEG
jgi:hypothetical protein